MKTSTARPMCPRRKTARAFTLVEIMVAVSVFTLAVAAMVSTQLFGLRIATLAANRTSMNSDGRQTMDQIRDAVRGALTLRVGSCSPTNPASFLLATSAQQGSALLAFSTTNTALDEGPYVIYYLDAGNPGTNYLKSYTMDADGNTATRVLAAGITNTVIFYAEDFQGNVLSNYSNNRVIDVLLQFNQYAFVNGGASVRSGYQLRTRATQRTLNNSN